MISFPFLRQIIKSNIKFLFAFTFVLCLFLTVMCNVFTPETLQGVGRTASQTVLGHFLGGDTTLIGFMANFFYAVMAIIFPMLYCIVVGNRLIADKVDHGDMACFLSTPLTRMQIVCTSIFYFVGSLVVMWLIATGVGIIAARTFQPGALDTRAFIRINIGCFLYHTTISSICFFFSCVFNLTKTSLAFGAGIPLIFFVDNLMLKLSNDLDILKYFTLNTLLDMQAIIDGIGYKQDFLIFIMMSLTLYIASIIIFKKKNLPL